MNRKNRAAIAAAIYCASAFALIFALLGSLSHGFEMKSVVILGIAGAIFGCIGAPSLEPKAFARPALWEVIFSVLGCILFALAVESERDGYILAIIIGVILGYLAPYWIRHVQPPV